MLLSQKRGATAQTQHPLPIYFGEKKSSFLLQIWLNSVCKQVAAARYLWEGNAPRALLHPPSSAQAPGCQSLKNTPRSQIMCEGTWCKWSLLPPLPFITLPGPGAIVRTGDGEGLTTVKSISRASPPNLPQPVCRDRALSSRYLVFWVFGRLVPNLVLSDSWPFYNCLRFCLPHFPVYIVLLPTADSNLLCAYREMSVIQ